ncbi:MAG: LuxQ periplasmic sensor domain-containing protein [Motiliproteus sp.]
MTDDMHETKRSFSLFPLFLLIILTGFITVSVALLWSSSQLAKQAIDNDIRNYKEQTHHSLQLYLDNQFSLLNLLLNQYAENGALLDALFDKDTDRAVGSLFDLYNSDTGTNFDLLFILNDKDQVWIDASSNLMKASLPLTVLDFGKKPYTGWFLVAIGDDKDKQLVAFKRVPLVDDADGKVLAHLVGGIALTGNLGVINRAQNYLNVSALALRLNNQLFGEIDNESGLSIEAIAGDLQQVKEDLLLKDPYVISRYRLTIEDAPSELEIITLSEYSTVSQVGYNYLTQSYRLIPLFVAIAAIITLLMIRIGIQPLLKLVISAKSAVSERKEIPFTPTMITEYNALGSSLKELVDSLEEKEKSLQDLNEDLEQRVIQRTEELQKSNELLVQAQQHMVETEKMASLGQLVAGMAHEINTPLGVSLTAITTLQDEIKELQKHYKEGTISRSYLEEHINGITEGVDIAITNLINTTELVGVFKQVAVDQASEMPRVFNLGQYMEEVVRALTPMLKRQPHTLTIDGPDNIQISSYPGYLNQILTNLIQNSLIHGLQGIKEGKICLRFEKDNDYAVVHYSDNGKGMDQVTRERCFDPFYTTKRGEGSTGLGMSLIYNLTVQGLNGTLKLTTAPNEGVHFVIRIPIEGKIVEESTTTKR